MPDKKLIDDLKAKYTPGTRVRLVHMNDPQAPADGAEGTVTAVDDMGTVHVLWDNGSTLGAIYGEDVFYKIID